jgi:hypothetical protein
MLAIPYLILGIALLAIAWMATASGPNPWFIGISAVAFLATAWVSR